MSLWLLPGVQATRGAESVVSIVVAVLLVGALLRPLITRLTVLTGVETRTSSPVRITRGDDFVSLNTAGLFPAGEGAGYAGGILSAAVDGIKVAEAVALSLTA